MLFSFLRRAITSACLVTGTAVFPHNALCANQFYPFTERYALSKAAWEHECLHRIIDTSAFGHQAFDLRYKEIFHKDSLIVGSQIRRYFPEQSYRMERFFRAYQCGMHLFSKDYAPSKNYVPSKDLLCVYLAYSALLSPDMQDAASFGSDIVMHEFTDWSFPLSIRAQMHTHARHTPKRWRDTVNRSMFFYPVLVRDGFEMSSVNKALAHNILIVPIRFGAQKEGELSSIRHATQHIDWGFDLGSVHKRYMGRPAPHLQVQNNQHVIENIIQQGRAKVYAYMVHHDVVDQFTVPFFYIFQRNASLVRRIYGHSSTHSMMWFLNKRLWRSKKNRAYDKSNIKTILSMFVKQEGENGGPFSEISYGKENEKRSAREYKKAVTLITQEFETFYKISKPYLCALEEFYLKK